MTIEVDRVVVPTDLSEASGKAFPPAVAWAKAHGAAVTMFHVVEDLPLVAYAPLEGTYADLAGYHEVAVDRATELLETRAEELSKELGVEIEPHIATGDPAECVTRYVETLDHPWVVLTTTGRSGLEHVLLGSTAEKIARFAPCPILAVGRTKTPSKSPKVLWASDLSPTSMAALPLAARLATERGATLECCTVLDDSLRYYLVNLGLYPTIDAETFYLDSKTEAAARLESEAEKQLGGKLSGGVHVRQGQPAREICDLAEEIGADLVVVSSHGRTGWRRVLMGSVAEKVLREAPCDVVVAHFPRVDDAAQQAAD